MTKVLITDHAWNDTELERGLIERAGFSLVSAQTPPTDGSAVERLVAQHQPDAILTCWAPVSTASVMASRRLKAIGRFGVGLDNIDVATATRRGIQVTNVPDYCVEEVSDHAVGMLLAWARGIVAFDRSVKQGRWEPQRANLRRVRDLTVGIVGFGRIGTRTAQKLEAFGCRILVHTHPQPVQSLPAATSFVALDELLAGSDVVILHVPLLPETHHLIDARALATIRPGALLINVSRGPLVDNAALLAALESGRLVGAALDVVEGEPEPPAALTSRDDVLVTPHVAFSSISSVLELRRRATEDVIRVLSGQEPQNPCNRPEPVG